MKVSERAPVVLCAVLASPSLTSGVRTRQALARLGEVLQVSEIRVVNLLNMPSQDFQDMALVGADEQVWEESRPSITSGVVGADLLLAAWGLADLTGPATTHRRDQIRWFRELAAGLGHEDVLTVGGAPRHPSRWHRLVSDRHGWQEPGSSTDRLRAVLMSVPLHRVSPAPVLPGPGQLSTGKPRLSDPCGSLGEHKFE